MKLERTEFGKRLRRLRILNEETLGDTADKLNISASMLSAMEIGRKSPPDELVLELINHFQLEGEAAKQLLDLGRISKKSLKLDLGLLSESHKETAAVFARQLPNLSEDRLKNLRALLDPDEEGGA